MAFQDSTPEAEAPFADAVEVLNYALTLEHLEATFYREGLGDFGPAIFEQAGFDVVAVEPVTGTWFLLYQEAAYAVRRLSRRNPLTLLLSLPLTHALQGLALLGDRVTFDDAIGTGHIIVGRKPTGG